MVELRVREEVTEEIRRRDQDMGDNSGYGIMASNMSQVLLQLEERMKESVKLLREDFERREREMKTQIGQLEEELYQRESVIEKMQSMFRDRNGMMNGKTGVFALMGFIIVCLIKK